MGLPDKESKEMEVYFEALNHAQIKLRDGEDVLIWDANQTGKYNPKAVYLVLSADGVNRAEAWWWKYLWKIKCPPKCRLFVWCVIENKAPCWENLQKRYFQGPGWCSLCKNAG